jgi:serine/threonine protein kinase
MGPERFAREIAVAARLQHPHILGLLDSGDADGFFYYVIPDAAAVAVLSASDPCTSISVCLRSRTSS